jgi:DNA-binding PadR family transcriptional regulator
LNPGTLYPSLHATEQKGYLKSRKERHGKTERSLYRATPMGRKARAVVRKYLAKFLAVGNGVRTSGRSG